MLNSMKKYSCFLLMVAILSSNAFSISRTKIDRKFLEPNREPNRANPTASSGYESDRKRLEAEQASLNKEIASLNSKKSSLENDKANKEKEIKSLDQQISTNNSKIKTQEQNLADLNRKIDLKQQDIDLLQQEIDRLKKIEGQDKLELEQKERELAEKKNLLVQAEQEEAALVAELEEKELENQDLQSNIRKSERDLGETKELVKTQQRIDPIVSDLENVLDGISHQEQTTEGILDQLGVILTTNEAGKDLVVCNAYRRSGSIATAYHCFNRFKGKNLNDYSFKTLSNKTYQLGQIQEELIDQDLVLVSGPNLPVVQLPLTVAAPDISRPVQMVYRDPRSNLTVNQYCQIELSSDVQGYFNHDCSTVPGASGAVFLQDQKIVGTHLARWTTTESVKGFGRLAIASEYGSLAIMQKVLAYQSLDYYYDNRYDLDYDNPNEVHDQEYLNDQGIRNYSREFQKIYGPEPLQEGCATKFGCNFFTESKLNKMRDKARSQAVMQTKNYRKKLEEALEGGASDIEKIKAGGSAESKVGVAISEPIREKLRKELDDLTADNKNMTGTLESGQVVVDTDTGLTPDAPSGVSKGWSNNSGLNIESVFTDDHQANLNYLNRNIRAQMANNKGHTAENLAKMYQRYKNWVETGDISPAVLANAIQGRYPGLSVLDSNTFIGSDSIRIMNAFSVLDRSRPEVSFWENMAATILDPANGLMSDIGLFLGHASRLWTIISELGAVQGLVGGVEGVYYAGKDAVSGIWTLVSDFPGTVSGMYEAVINIETTWKMISAAISDSYDKVVNCDLSPRECGQVLGRAVAEIVMFKLSLGVSASGKLGMVASKASKFLIETSQNIGVISKSLGLSRQAFEIVGDMSRRVLKCTGTVCSQAVLEVQEALLEASASAGKKGNEVIDYASDIADSAKDAINTMGASKFNEVLKTSKGSRPDPSLYLSKSYIKEHLAKFDEGASRFMPKTNLDDYGPAQIDGTSFVMPKHEADNLILKAGGDKRKIEQSLGLPTGFLDNSEIVRIDISNPKQFNARIPTGNEAGASPQWLPGGKLPDGISEAVLDLGDVPSGAGTWTSYPLSL